MKSILNKLTNEEYRTLWSKSLELRSIQEHEDRMRLNLEELKNIFLLLSVHHEYRSPWAIKTYNPKGETLSQIFAKNDPSTDNLITVNDKIVQNFIQSMYNDRANILLHFVSDERISAQKINWEVHSCQISIGSFLATLVIPSFFGHFLGNSNIDAFIESIGIVFDSYSHDPVPFLSSFDNSFVCDVLRQFFFSPLIRPYVGEQFTVFYEFFSSKRGSDGYSYTKIQRFFSLFLKEMAAPISVSPPFIRRLFRRICAQYDDNKEKVIMSIIIYCIVTNMISYPTAYSVYPLTSGVKGETSEFIQLVKFYCAFVCDLPLSQQALLSNTPIKETEQLDKSLVRNLVDILLAPTAADAPMPEVGQVSIPMASVLFLAKFEENDEVLSNLNDSKLRPESVLKFTMNSPSKEKKSTKGRSETKLLSEMLASSSPEVFRTGRVSPANRATLLYLTKSGYLAEYSEMVAKIEEQSKSETEALTSIHAKVGVLQRAISMTKESIAASETKFANDIVNSIVSGDASILSEIEKKKSQMINDPSVFASFITSHLDAFLAKNGWVSPMMRMVARRFHAQVMQHFGTSAFLDEKRQFIITDQKFINQKNHFLANLEQNGLDEKVAKIVKCKDIFAAAQTAVLRACLFENPLESAKLIVLSLSVVEDLFVFEFGEPPEANQLMPLLANLFISTPIPNPLSFGEWLAHFLQKLMQERPEWFSDESMMPMEHYFQFNAWMEDMLQSLENSK